MGICAQNEVVAMPGLGEVLLFVVYDVVCAQGAGQIQISSAADRRDFRSEPLGELYGKGAKPPEAPSIKTVCPGLSARDRGAPAGQ